ncbi:hypothetical protein FIU87_13460 [Bacillus sp. THAF10]|uniref:hypothetical protein n=1 Tax=Bacillus sp. THAF10 TaxID=2587848 RepID=UPI0012A862B3|nr:hypothetical protein [Bacillus sp. THAF10]QFT89663.1 hypothetical protein FIU87_13460 [Bacillus sp. THAF10]
MYKKLSNIDFRYFIGQRVIEINKEKNEPFGMALETGGLIIECPWRLRIANQIEIGYSDCIHSPGEFSHKNVEKVLLDKRIKNIFLFEEVSDLFVEFENGIYLELFHDSNYFEGWQLRGDDGFYLFSLPGGSYSY